MSQTLKSNIVLFYHKLDKNHRKTWSEALTLAQNIHSIGVYIERILKLILQTQ